MALFKIGLPNKKPTHMGFVARDIAHFELTPWAGYRAVPQGDLTGQEDGQLEVTMGLRLIQAARRLLGGQRAAQGPHAMSDGTAKAKDSGADQRGMNRVKVSRNLGKSSAQIGRQHPALGA